MGRFTYYSPFGLGLVLILTLHGWVRESCPAALAAWPWLFVGLVAVVVGLLCQLVMIGVQGAFAQVLPAPGGRSIRGGAARLAGGLLIGCGAAALIGALLRSEGLTTAAWVLLVLAAAQAGGAILVYIWSWPAALRDFGEEAD
jgi:hypothetical protein